MKKVVIGFLCILGLASLASAIMYKIKGDIAVSIIGGADGPTSIFLAGKVGNDYSLYGILAGIVFLLVAIILYIRTKH